jgi:hypothetical protein
MLSHLVGKGSMELITNDGIEFHLKLFSKKTLLVDAVHPTASKNGLEAVTSTSCEG